MVPLHRTQTFTRQIHSKELHAMSKVHFLSLGCPKNRVDSEHMVGIALAQGQELVDDPDDADAIVVNTCAFIGDAKKESVEAILAMTDVKARGNQQLIVAGCLAQRYVDDLENELPEVDHFLGTGDYEKIGQLLALNGEPIGVSEAPSSLVQIGGLKKKEERNWVSDDLQFVADESLPRTNSLARYTAYLKIAEGCDNTCAFCIIPKLRGKQRSRSVDDLVTEATRLAKGGVVELNLIAQDLTGYGHDLDGRPTLALLLERLQEVEGIRWVRCMYAYPRTLSDSLLHVLDSGRNTLPYLDIPVQHGSDRILRRMRRGRDQKRLSSLLLRVKEKVAHLVLRSTVIVGFPGEDDDDFQKLVDFVNEVRFQRLGVFKYSDEEDTAAYELDEKLPYAVKRSRYEKLMRRQRRIHRTHLQSMIGEVHEALVEGPSEEHAFLVVGRIWSQAPDIDGMTYLSSTRPLQSGEIVQVRITEAHDYDLVGEVLAESDPDALRSIPFRAREAQRSNAEITSAPRREPLVMASKD
jgi:ribosomal protein S12 methylthiotransferase